MVKRAADVFGHKEEADDDGDVEESFEEEFFREHSEVMELKLR